MNTLNKTAFLAVALSLCILFVTVENNAQCVACTPAPPGFICTPSTIGGQACATGDGGTCTLTGSCIPSNDRPGVPCTPKILKNPQVKITDELILDVAGTDTRMAIALINIRKIMVEFRVARISFSPVEYTAEDVTNHISQRFDSQYFKDLRKRAGDMFAVGNTPITYEVSINEDSASDSFTLTVRSAESSGFHSAIELSLKKATFGKGKNQSEGFKVLNWQFK